MRKVHDNIRKLYAFSFLQMTLFPMGATPGYKRTHFHCINVPT